MTYTIVALTNNKARLIVKKAEVSHDEAMAKMIAQTWEAEGFYVTTYEES